MIKCGESVPVLSNPYIPCVPGLQPVTIEVTCPKCGSVVQIMLTSNIKSAGKS